MRLVRFGSWITAILTFMIIIGAGIHSAFNFIMPTIGVDGNHAQAGGYTMELVVASIAFVSVLWRLLWALDAVETGTEAWKLLKTRPAVLAIGLAGLVFMVLTNRFFWWQKHMFTSQAFDSTGSYTGAANAVLVSFVLCVLVYAFHAKPDNIDETLRVYRKTRFPLGLPTALTLWSAGWVGFAIGSIIYVSNF